jgi:hypothetical protein
MQQQQLNVVVLAAFVAVADVFVADFIASSTRLTFFCYLSLGAQMASAAAGVGAAADTKGIDEAMCDMYGLNDALTYNTKDVMSTPTPGRVTLADIWYPFTLQLGAAKDKPLSMVARRVELFLSAVRHLDPDALYNRHVVRQVALGLAREQTRIRVCLNTRHDGASDARAVIIAVLHVWHSKVRVAYRCENARMGQHVMGTALSMAHCAPTRLDAVHGHKRITASVDIVLSDMHDLNTREYNVDQCVIIVGKPQPGVAKSRAEDYEASPDVTPEVCETCHTATTRTCRCCRMAWYCSVSCQDRHHTTESCERLSLLAEMIQVAGVDALEWLLDWANHHLDDCKRGDAVRAVSFLTRTSRDFDPNRPIRMGGPTHPLIAAVRMNQELAIALLRHPTTDFEAKDADDDTPLYATLARCMDTISIVAEIIRAVPPRLLTSTLPLHPHLQCTLLQQCVLFGAGGGHQPVMDAYAEAYGLDSNGLDLHQPCMRCNCEPHCKVTRFAELERMPGKLEDIWTEIVQRCTDLTTKARIYCQARTALLCNELQVMAVCRVIDSFLHCPPPPPAVPLPLAASV